MKKLREPILADGEVTGHAHRLSSGVEVFEREDGIREFELKHSDVLRHEEHGPITLAPQKYESGRVLEYDHFAEEAKIVAD